MMLKLRGKKLSSGNIQVKFSMGESGGKKYYGYLLVDPGTGVSKVVEEIRNRMDQRNTPELFDLNNAGKRSSSGVLLFKKQIQ